MLNEAEREEQFTTLGKVRDVLVQLPEGIDLVRAEVLLGNSDSAVEVLTAMRVAFHDVDSAVAAVIEVIKK